MIKVYCDACEREIETARPRVFSYLCHIDDMVEGNIGAYIDKEGNPVSGRLMNKDLCSRCYNLVLFEAVKKLNEIEEGEEKP